MHLIRWFHFLGSLYFAISLIALSALIAMAGTLLESHTGSHLFAAQWTYGNPLFAFLLCLFFINILFSALRRWPFKKRHIPFLITHLGLLMIIGGTILKNHMGLQGRLSVWEGSGSQTVLLPHTHALVMEEKDIPFHPTQKNIIPLHSFQPAIYSSLHSPHLTGRLVGFSPHVEERLESWIKEDTAYVSGFPPIPVRAWELPEPIPAGASHRFGTENPVVSWSILALRTAHTQEALRQVYLQGLILRVKAKTESDGHVDISLAQAIAKPFAFAHGNMAATLDLRDPPLDGGSLSSLSLLWQSEEGLPREKFTIPLQGENALLLKHDLDQWSEAPFTADLVRPQPILFLIDDGHENILFCACDIHGRVHTEAFNSADLKAQLAYDQGFAGYGIQAIVPIPSFPSGREDKERASAYVLESQLRQAFSEQLPLSPPLHFFEQGCRRSEIDFARTLVEFLTAWQGSARFLFHPVQPLSPSLHRLLEHLDWEKVSDWDRTACQWSRLLLDRLEISLKKGGKPLEILEHWPLLKDFREALQSADQEAPPTVLAKQISSLAAYLPPLSPLSSLPIPEQAVLLSAYFRAYGLDYGSLTPSRGHGKEQFESLKIYWRAHAPDKETNPQQAIAFETTLTHRIVPATPPLKPEELRPGIVMEIQDGKQRQLIALAYDASGTGLKWPILNGKYLVRFQPEFKELPYRVRLRQARKISYPHSPQMYSYESDVLISHPGDPPVATTLSMNHVYETWDGYRFYLSGVGTAANSGLSHIQLAVNHDPAKYLLTYPGALLVSAGIVLLFWIQPYRKTGS